MNNRVSDMAATVGLDFQLQDAHPANTFRAHRLLHFAATKGLGNELTERLMRGYFSEGVRIGNRDALVELAVEVGLDEAETAAVLDGNAFEAEVNADIELARAFGATGVPFFVFDRKYAVSGAQETAVFSEVLDTAWAAAKPLDCRRHRRCGVRGRFLRGARAVRRRSDCTLCRGKAPSQRISALHSVQSTSAHRRTQRAAIDYPAVRGLDDQLASAVHRMGERHADPIGQVLVGRRVEHVQIRPGADSYSADVLPEQGGSPTRGGGVDGLLGGQPAQQNTKGDNEIHR